MNADFISKIKNAEEKAAQMVKQANLDAKAIVAEAGKDAYALLEAQREKAQKSLSVMVELAGAKAEEEKVGILKNAHVQVDAMKMLAEPKLDRASDYIIERIVSMDGHR